jgi:TorA maturation chaperone TorD
MVADEELARADIYAILAAGLRTPLLQSQFQWLSELAAEADQSPLATSWKKLAEAANNADEEAEAEEFHRLFVGMSGGLLTPYASWYINGNMFAQPLVELRATLSNIGIATPEQEKEPEDHLGYLCNLMQYLIAKGDDDSAKLLMNRFLQPWVRRFAVDMANNAHSIFYRAFADLLDKFLEIESIYYFELSDK